MNYLRAVSQSILRPGEENHRSMASSAVSLSYCANSVFNCTATANPVITPADTG